MQAIHQFVAGFAKGDAISNEARVLRRLFRAWGHPSEIYCEARRILPELRAEALDVGAARAAIHPDDIVLLHLSIGSAVNEIFAGLDCRKAILYHNVTPPEYFRAVNPQTAQNLARGLEQARQLAGAAPVVMADSDFNARELEQMGHSHVRVLPLVLDFSQVRAGVDRGIRRRFGDDGLVNILFVGRGAPNKRLEDVLAAFHYFQRFVEPNSRLLHVGSFAGAEIYQALLLGRVRDWDLKNVEFLGNLPQPMLNAAYGCAHVFLSMSEHEGFCIPLLEAMACDVPVLAFAAAAVPETLAGAGVLFREKDFALVAEMAGRLAREAALRAAVLQGQRERLARYQQRDLAAELRGRLAPLLSG